MHIPIGRMRIHTMNAHDGKVTSARERQRQRQRKREHLAHA